jgi:hypothetical protein
LRQRELFTHGVMDLSVVKVIAIKTLHQSQLQYHCSQKSGESLRDLSYRIYMFKTMTFGPQGATKILNSELDQEFKMIIATQGFRNILIPIFYDLNGYLQLLHPDNRRSTFLFCKLNKSDKLVER